MKQLTVMIATMCIGFFAYAGDELTEMINNSLLSKDIPLGAYIEKTESQISGSCEIQKQLTYAYPLEEALFASATKGYTVHFICRSSKNNVFTILVKGEVLGEDMLKSTRISLLP